MNGRLRVLPKTAEAVYSGQALVDAALRFREPAQVVAAPSGARGVVVDGEVVDGTHAGANAAATFVGELPGLYPEWLGDRSFNDVHGVRFPYVVGEMANGIASVDMVLAAGRAGLLGFFGAAGLHPSRVEDALHTMRRALGDEDRPYGANLIHSPHEPDLENAVVDLYLKHGLTKVSASAYMGLTPMVVRYAATGLSVDGHGHIRRRNAVFAKISRPEVAARFLAPAPDDMLADLVAKGQLTAREADLARRVPIAEDITVEADSGGHTDNQVLTAVFPTVLALKNALTEKHAYARPVRVGAAGGLGTPSAVAAAFGLGAAYVLTGSVNQATREAGLSTRAKQLLTTARLGDVVMAPAADMFEMGVKVQVLKRGTMFGVRAQKLYDVYRAHASLDDIPSAERARLEKDIFQMPIDEMWATTAKFFETRDPRELEKAAADPKHKMALVFRAYLGQSSKWAIGDAPGRALDFQIWCGPAMGAFNEWVEGSFLEPLEARNVEQIARNLLEGACVVTRAAQFRNLGVAMPDAAFSPRPRPLA
jgi:trans-AT polyketide synthase/acyltransferase/oxidoreductase domain-containing protein